MLGDDGCWLTNGVQEPEIVSVNKGDKFLAQDENGDVFGLELVDGFDEEQDVPLVEGVLVGALGS